MLVNAVECDEAGIGMRNDNPDESQGVYLGLSQVGVSNME